MTKYRKKPVVIEAICFTGNNLEEVKEFMKGSKLEISGAISSVTIYTLEGDMLANKGDWIIKGVKGEFYPCKPDIFEATYEKVE